jgi:hypothetical protein
VTVDGFGKAMPEKLAVGQLDRPGEVIEPVRGLRRGL